MVGRKRELGDADNDRRRFLVLATKLGVSIPPVVTLALTRRSYAAGSGFTSQPSPGNQAGESVVPRNFVPDHDHDHRRS